MTNWATTTDVFNLTGVTVTDAEIAMAQGIIDLFSEVSTLSAFDGDGNSTGIISRKNLRYLMMAVAYQTAWMQEHPDVFSNIDTSTYSEDGVSATQSNTSAHLLAPLARRALLRLTWLRPNRSIKIGKPVTPLPTVAFGRNRDSAPADDERYWTPT